MPDIKIRDVVKGTVKAIDKSAVAAERMKDAYVRTKDKAEHGIFAAESSPEEYAADRTLTGTETAAHEAVHGLDQAGRKGVKVTKQNISKAKEHFQLRKADLPKKPVHNTIKANSRSRQAFASSTRKTAVKATTTAVKAVIAKAKALAAAIAAGGWVSVTVIIVVCLIGLIVGSCFGIFFSGEGSGTGQTMRQAVQEINADYQSQIDTARANLTYDELEMSGSRAVWPEVLAVYAVKTTTDPNDPQEVATVDDAKKAILKDIFWQMNEISSHIERKPGKIITETDDGHGNIVETITTVTHTYLYITVSHKTAEEMADRFNFNADQRQQLSELLVEENRSMWSAVLYGIYSGDDAIVTVALSQIGNVGGQPYWSWYGFNSRVEWCACFVSWCANECGYIDSGVIPKFAGCVNGVQWFKDRGQWQDGSFEPSAGQIIFFDWDNKGSSGPQDGQSDQPREQRRDAAREDQRDEDREHKAHRAAKAARAEDPAEQIRQRELDGGAAEEVIDLILRREGHHEDAVGIRAEEHEARLTEGEQTREAVEQVHRNGHERIHRGLFQHREELTGGQEDRGGAWQEQIQVLQQDHQKQQTRDAQKRGQRAFFALFLFQHLTCTSP